MCYVYIAGGSSSAWWWLMAELMSEGRLSTFTSSQPRCSSFTDTTQNLTNKQGCRSRPEPGILGGAGAVFLPSSGSYSTGQFCGSGSGSVESVSFPWIRIRIKKWLDPDPTKTIENIK